MSNIRTMVRSAYDLQELRIQMGNRIVAQFKSKLGQEPGEKEDTISEEGQELLARLRDAHKRITDGVVRVPKVKNFAGFDLIDSYTEFCLVSQYLEIEESETTQFKRLKEVLKEYPIYTEFLDGVKGVGPAMAAVIISEFDIHKAKYPSSLWKYAGLDVKADGRGASRRAEHLVDVEYTSKDGEIKTKKSLGYNPWLKTKLVGVLGSCFIRAGDNHYRSIYLMYKNRLENHPNWKEKTKKHRHAAATRYMIKMFLVDLYGAWRKLEGLPVSPTYQEAKLGYVHHSEAA